MSRAGRAEITVDLDRPGRSAGHLVIRPMINGAMKEIRSPVYVFRNGTGPTLLLTGGVHGDEYEGPIALANLVSGLDVGKLAGRLIITPFLNVPAIRAAQRCSPDDGKDLNRSFPGDPNGTPTEGLANLVATRLVAVADFVIDLHTGGGRSSWIPCAMMHPLSDPEEYERTLALVTAIQAPAGVVIDESDKPGMFDTYVEGLRKPFVCCEFGGGMVSPENIAVAKVGVRNALRHLGMLDGDRELPIWRGRRESRLIEIPHLGYAVEAPVSGLFEPLVEIGDSVLSGQPIGRIHSFDDAERPAVTVKAPENGILFHRRAAARIDAGQRSAMVARPLQRA
jgi:N2-acetyl-L-2,4-diaminobutanoate deacetylase